VAAREGLDNNGEAVRLYSVWDGPDPALLDRMLEFYPPSPVRSVLDCTYNRGRMWKGSRFAPLVTGMDIDPKYKPHLVGDNRVMEGVKDASFCAGVYDPPHLPNQGRDKKKDFQDRFGLTHKAGKADGYSLGHTHKPVLLQLQRVIVPNGIILAKLCDYVHNHAHNWTLVDFIVTVRECGLTPCDLIIKTRKGPVIDPKWKVAHHARQSHCWWVVVRNGPSCEG
jgi:hypothetical protein